MSMNIFKKSPNKENLILDQLNLITSILSQDDLYEKLKDKVKSAEQDADRNFTWYQKEKDKVRFLEDIKIKLESRIFRLEQEMQFYEDNKENFDLLKKETQERLNKITTKERCLEDKQMILDVKTDEILKQQTQYVELLKIFRIKHDIKDLYQEIDKGSKNDKKTETKNNIFQDQERFMSVCDQTTNEVKKREDGKVLKPEG